MDETEILLLILCIISIIVSVISLIWNFVLNKWITVVKSTQIEFANKLNSVHGNTVNLAALARANKMKVNRLKSKK